MKTVLLYSGGMGSFLAGYLLKKQGVEDVTLYFNDTKTEDKDLYRFLEETKDFLGYPFIQDSDGRDIWQVFIDSRFMSNTRIDTCSRVLKRERSRRFIKSFKPTEVQVAIGLHWSESDRLERAKPYWEPYRIFAPMCNEILDYQELKREALSVSGIREPYLYTIGLEHNNCGGFCVKAGLGHYRQLLEADRERYLYFEMKEQEVYDACPKCRPFLRKTLNGVRHYLTLKQYRQLLESGDYTQTDEDHNGGCNSCAIS